MYEYIGLVLELHIYYIYCVFIANNRKCFSHVKTLLQSLK